MNMVKYKRGTKSKREERMRRENVTGGLQKELEGGTAFKMNEAR